MDLHAIQTDMAGLVNDQGVEIDKIGELVVQSPTLSVPIPLLVEVRAEQAQGRVERGKNQTGQVRMNHSMVIY